MNVQRYPVGNDDPNKFQNSFTPAYRALLEEIVAEPQMRRRYLPLLDECAIVSYEVFLRQSVRVLLLRQSPNTAIQLDRGL